jgi:hypothetical protein
MFMAVDGIRTINFFGFLSDPNPDLAVPFIYAGTPSRCCAGFNSDTYRIFTNNTSVTGTSKQDWWYNLSRKSWTGPHTFQYDLAIPLSNDFLLASVDNLGGMWGSYTVQNHNGLGTTFTENGTDLTWGYGTVAMADLDNIYANSLERTTLEIAVPSSGQTYNFAVNNESGTQLASASVTEGTSEMIWGSSKWGVAMWGASTTGLAPLTIDWNQVAVSNRFVFEATGPSGLGFKISSLHCGYKRLNYLLN